MERRELLVGCGAFVGGLISGLVLGDDDSSGTEQGVSAATPAPTATSTATSTPTPRPTPSPTDTPTPTETPTPTPSPTETPTPTPTPTPSGNYHSLNEQFTVGEGEDAIIYRVNEFYRADELGNRTSKASAQGVFLVVIVEVTNPHDSLIVLPHDDFRLLSRELNKWIRFDHRGSEQIDNDDRLDVPSLGNRGIRSEETINGAVAFDANPDGSYHVYITPASEADTPEHYVPIGDVSDVQRL